MTHTVSVICLPDPQFNQDLLCEFSPQASSSHLQYVFVKWEICTQHLHISDLIDSTGDSSNFPTFLQPNTILTAAALATTTNLKNNFPQPELPFCLFFGITLVHIQESMQNCLQLKSTPPVPWIFRQNAPLFRQ